MTGRAREAQALEVQDLGAGPAGEPVTGVILRRGALEVRTFSFGATLCGLVAPDRRGRPGAVVLSRPSWHDYETPRLCLGSTVGRYANRIAGGRFELDGRSVALPCNEGEHHLHGGAIGFDRVHWRTEPLADPHEPGVIYRHESPAGSEGYPGNLEAAVRYQLDGEGALLIDLRARSDAPTPVSLTNHSYFHLGDGGASAVLDHELAIPASAFTPVDTAGIPTGEIAAVAGTPLDFRVPRRLGDGIDALHDGRGGYDHNLVLDGEPGTLRPAAVLVDPASGRRLRLCTTLPGLQLYSGNHLRAGIPGAEGQVFGPRQAVCLEPQIFPDAPNHPDFPDAILRPGETWHHRIRLRLDVSPP